MERIKYFSKDLQDLHDRLLEEKSLEVIEKELIKFNNESHFLSGLWVLRDVYAKITEEKIKESLFLSTTYITILICAGEIDKAYEFLSLLPKDSINYIFSFMVFPDLDYNSYHAIVEQGVALLKQYGLESLPQLTITAARPSVLNGFRDFSAVHDALMFDKEKTLNNITSLHGHSTIGVMEVTEAEKLYYTDKTYDALVRVVGIIPFLKEKKDSRILFPALYLQIRIMLLSGQISSTVPMIAQLKDDMKQYGTEEYIPNILAVEAWTYMFEGQYEKINDWLLNDAPDELSDFCMLDLYAYMIKIRAYIIQEKYMPALALAEKLLPLMKLSYRLMDSCELHILLAIIAMQTNQQERMITHIREALLLSKEYEYDRLLADEGEKMRQLLIAYKNYCSSIRYMDSELDEYIDKIMPMVLKVSEHYPRYLKTQLPEMQSLTTTELTVLRLLADGQSNSEIADYLSVSLSGVKFHVANIYEKLQVNRRMEAVRIAKELGIV